MIYDVIIVGGSYAGMAAALQVARARKHVLIIDESLRRNRFAASSHGYLGYDGTAPDEIIARARQQLMRYQTVHWSTKRAETVTGRKGDFELKDDAGIPHKSRRVLFAVGVVDTLPAIAGIEERWGRTIFHCPYCHGFELNQDAIGVIGATPLSFHQAMMLPDWGTTTFFTNRALELDDAQRKELRARNVCIEETGISIVEGHSDVRLNDGRLLSFAGLFVASRTSPASPVAERAGCEIEETVMGLQIKTNEMKETSIPGIFACGDSARVPHSISFAVADGAWAGAQVHRSLMF
jgi:thioredoxin reductase